MELQKKMLFVQKRDTVFGRNVSEGGVSVPPESIHCVAQWPVPKKPKRYGVFFRVHEL